MTFKIPGMHNKLNSLLVSGNQLPLGGQPAQPHVEFLAREAIGAQSLVLGGRMNASACRDGGPGTSALTRSSVISSWSVRMSVGLSYH